MSRLIWLSDLHFAAQGLVLNHDPRVRLNAAIDHINTYHADCDACILSGDLVNRGTLQDYEALAASLSRLNVPYLPMVGNHDDRLLLRQTLDVPHGCMDDFIQYHSTFQNTGVVALDTQKKGADSGTFCEHRAEWLEHVLAGTSATSVLVFGHHPPLALGLPMQDGDMMEGGDAFVARLKRHSCVKMLCVGHVHRPTSGTVQGLPFATMRSILYQAPAPRPAWDWDSFAPSEEAPQLGVIHITEDNVVIQYEQFCPFDLGVSTDKGHQE